jgi:hypothetical protein
LAFVHSVTVFAQSTSTVLGSVVDPSGAAVPSAAIVLQNQSTGEQHRTRTNRLGSYQIAALPLGIYTISVQAPGFQTYIVENFQVEVGRGVIQDFQLSLGSESQQVTVTSEPSLIENVTISAGSIIDRQTVQQVPLNGRYFLDLGVLIPGSVVPPQGAFSAAPTRGLGALAFNTAGNREETVNYLINGITLNNLTFSSLSFQPSINTIEEFRVDNSTFSAAYGQSSGAVVNVATRSGSNTFHGDVFEFLRNDVFDARNFFTLTSSEPPPFIRNQFGGSLGGPIVRNRTFFFFSYEGLRQRQGLDLNSLVLTDAERASARDSIIRGLIELLPRANYVDSAGTARYIGSATAPVDMNQWTIDIGHNLTDYDRLHGYYAIQVDTTNEPARFGNTVPGFGNVRESRRQLLTLNEVHTFGPTAVNEARAGFNRIHGIGNPNARLNPADFGIVNGRNEPVGLPQINIAGGALNFGGPAPFPVGRADTTWIVNDTLNLIRGRHSLKLGGEFRRFFNNNFRTGTGTFNFPTVAAFLAGSANSFDITLGNQASSIVQDAVGFFAQDNVKCRPGLTLELGLRYDWNVTPREKHDRFVVFETATASLTRVGGDRDIYGQNNRNFQPRAGFVWDPLRSGKMSVRGAYAILVDQPMTSVVSATSSNPPLARPLFYAGGVRFDNAIRLAQSAGLAPATVNPEFKNAYLQSWNLNIQRELGGNFAVMSGYFGSKGTNLILRRNINQPVEGRRPYPVLSPSSPILPGAALGNIVQVDSAGNSSYHALWLSVYRRLSRGLQFRAAYTWAKSLDYNSLSSQGVVVQDSYNLRGDRGLSDFDVRNRVVVSALFELPFRRNVFLTGWQIATVFQAQTGNPINIATTNTTVNGIAGTLRPDINGPVRLLSTVERWFDTSAFIPVNRFGNLGRNSVLGPGFTNWDASVRKETKVWDAARIEFRVEVFDVLNHANFGEPGRVVGSPSFGRITSTRFPTGESGSSRQVQLSLRFTF